MKVSFFHIVIITCLFTSCQNHRTKLVKEKTSNLKCYFFFIQDCPASKYAISKVAQMDKAYPDSLVKFIGVYSDPVPNLLTMRKLVNNHSPNLTIIIDSTLAIAKKYNATTTPQFILLDEAEKVLYDGRIDDYYIDFGKHGDDPKDNYVQMAIETLKAGKGKYIRSTKPIGCKINHHFFDNPILD